MGSRVHFFAVGVAVSALCFLLASMTWQYVLGLFVLAGMGCGVWSWLVEAERDRERARAERAERREAAEQRPESEPPVEYKDRPLARRRTQRPAQLTTGDRRRKSGNVVQFPVRDRQNSEAAD
jgi:hypothetical protein